MINEETSYQDRYVISSIDKLSWPDKVELQLWIAIKTLPMYNRFHKEVIELETCVKTNFYGLDFQIPIEDNIKRLDIDLKQEQDKWILSRDNGIYYHPVFYDDLNFRDKDRFDKYFYFWYWKKRLEYVRDLFAEHRGLFYGKKQSISGKQKKMPK